MTKRNLDDAFSLSWAHDGLAWHVAGICPACDETFRFVYYCPRPEALGDIRGELVEHFAQHREQP